LLLRVEGAASMAFSGARGRQSARAGKGLSPENFPPPADGPALRAFLGPQSAGFASRSKIFGALPSFASLRPSRRRGGASPVPPPPFRREGRDGRGRHPRETPHERYQGQPDGTFLRFLSNPSRYRAVANVRPPSPPGRARRQAPPRRDQNPGLGPFGARVRARRSTTSR
jgi:hypothetical protein